MCWNPKYAILIGFSTVVTYLSGILISNANSIKNEIKREKVKVIFVALSLVINLGILFFFKYYDFFFYNISRVFSIVNIKVNYPMFDIILPVGISFYTFQALSYTIDVYRGDIEAEKNLGKYALFVSFFPQLVAGPIEKSKDLLNQFNNTYSFEYERVKSGLLLMLWGFFQKIVVADRAAIMVNTIYNSPSTYGGFQIIIATLFFSFQIYCDFASYSNIAIGAAKVMGFQLTNNFDQPYFSRSIKDFWRRWHISLSSWFRDYLYIPLGGSRKGKLRTYINIMIVFLSSGLWHGASINFVVWGGLHGIYQIIGDMLRPIKDRFIKLFNIRSNVFSYKLMQIVINFTLVNFAWIFFRASSFSNAKILVKNLFIFNPWVLIDGSLFTLGLDKREFLVVLLSIILVVIVDLLQRKMNIFEALSEQNLLFRWGIYISTIVIILIFGSYGPTYSAQQFIYFQF
jgi:D-alanyl-lipoteichoic acid acyltransferase DltB (MBOAT superfamily)